MKSIADRPADSEADILPFPTAKRSRSTLSTNPAAWSKNRNDQFDVLSMNVVLK